MCVCMYVSMYACVSVIVSLPVKDVYPHGIVSVLTRVSLAGEKCTNV
jgi:hypothetical protein